MFYYFVSLPTMFSSYEWNDIVVFTNPSVIEPPQILIIALNEVGKLGLSLCILPNLLFFLALHP